MERVDYQKLLVQDLLNLNRNAELNLTPWYQRRGVWKVPQQAYLINTILESKPVPSIFIRHSVDLEQEKSVREVVDGQQRITSIIAFKNDEFSVRVPGSKKKLKFSQLSRSDKERFLYTELSVGVLIAAEEQDVIDIFGRINSISKNLNAQEKRNAEFSGEYKQFSLKKSTELLDFWRTRGVFSATDISRMKEVEFLSDLTMNLLSGLSDYSANKLNDQYRKYDEEFRDWGRAEKLIDTIFGKLIDLPKELVADTLFSRPPILFSLCMVLSNYTTIKSSKLRSIIQRIDGRINADIDDSERTKMERAFLQAMAASTQRITSRRARDVYIRSFFKMQ